MSDTDSGIKIYNNHQPSLTDGYYKIGISQNFSVSGNSFAVEDSALYFKVAGEQYSLAPQQINAVFPPAGALGDFTNVLPHIILNRSTLPWERKIDEKDRNVKPWLALLLLTEDEITDPLKFKTINTSQSNWENNQYTPLASADENPVSAIFVKSDLLRSALPGYNEIDLLAHVRGEADKEKAVVIGNRMPVKDKKNTVYLISLEDLYNHKQLSGKLNNGFYAFAVLKSWDFFCNDHFIVTPEVLKTCAGETDKIPAAVQDSLALISGAEYFNQDDFFKAILPLVTDVKVKKNIIDKFEIAHLTSILKHLNRSPSNLRLPGEDDLSVMGYLNVSYKLKTGSTIDSIFRGPLIPNNNALQEPLVKNTPLNNSDDLLRFIQCKDKNSQSYTAVDISYSSAWELGRLMAIKDKNFSIALFQWKRSCYQLYKSYMNIGGVSHLEKLPETLNYPLMPDSVRAWFNDLILLKNVPFNYLVPLEDYLPFESIRFFSVDQNWIKCLVDGAFSIARISDVDVEVDRQLYNQQSPYSKNPQSGFLLRSRAVSGWPDLVVDGEIKSTNAVNLNVNNVNGVTSYNKLSPDLLFCLFDQVIDMLHLYQKPESVHFGFEEDDNDATKLFAVNNNDNTHYSIRYDPNNKVHIDQLYTDLKVKSVSEFARALVQKIEKVSFRII